jgi:hypothetical protein
MRPRVRERLVYVKTHENALVTCSLPFGEALPCSFSASFLDLDLSLSVFSVPKSLA